MPSYDFERDEIIGCTEGTLVWWHERGHQVLRNNHGFRDAWYNFVQYLPLATIMFLTVQKFAHAQWLFISYILLLLSEEVFCWIYAFYKWEKR